jgi:hypothetical protein
MSHLTHVLTGGVPLELAEMIYSAIYDADHCLDLDIDDWNHDRPYAEKFQSVLPRNSRMLLPGDECALGSAASKILATQWYRHLNITVSLYLHVYELESLSMDLIDHMIEHMFSPQPTYLELNGELRVRASEDLFAAWQLRRHHHHNDRRTVIKEQRVTPIWSDQRWSDSLEAFMRFDGWGQGINVCATISSLRLRLYAFDWALLGTLPVQAVTQWLRASWPTGLSGNSNQRLTIQFRFSRACDPRLPNASDLESAINDVHSKVLKAHTLQCKYNTHIADTMAIIWLLQADLSNDSWVRRTMNAAKECLIKALKLWKPRQNVRFEFAMPLPAFYGHIGVRAAAQSRDSPVPRTDSTTVDYIETLTGAAHRMNSK